MGVIGKVMPCKGVCRWDVGIFMGTYDYYTIKIVLSDGK